MDEKTQCNSTKFVRLECDVHEDPHVYQIRHNLGEMIPANCQGCLNRRRKTIIAKAMDRYKQIKRQRDRLVLWTFGTSLHDTEFNRKKISIYWKKMNSWLRSQGKTKRTKAFKLHALMNALESGEKGNRLHYHMITRGYMPFEKVQTKWRKITEENSNVQYSMREVITTRKAIRAFSYLAKYTSKSAGAYYWMGDMVKAYTTPYVSNIENCKKWVLDYFDLNPIYPTDMEVTKFDFG